VKPVVVLTTGIALGLAAVLPLAHAQVTGAGSVATTAGPALVTHASGPDPTTATRATPGTTSGHRAQVVTVTGPVQVNPYGPVQVRVTLTDGVLTAVSATQLPRADRRSQAINDAAGPRRDREALASQGRTVDTVSGASYTSEGYRRSLQAALDTASQAAQAASPAAVASGAQ